MSKASSSSVSDEYSRALETIASHGVDFVICGGIACILHGSTRNTADLDLAVKLDDENLTKLVQAVRKLDLQPRIPEPLEAIIDSRKRAEWMTRKQAKVFTLVSPHSPLQIDIFLSYPVAYDQLRAQADVAQLGSTSVRFSSKQHLIDAKQAVQPSRMNDEIDIRILKELIAREQRPPAEPG